MGQFIGSGTMAQVNFNQTILPTKAYIFADNLKEDIKSEIFKSFDEILFRHEGGYFERYIVRRADTEYILVFQIVGAPMIIDILHILKDGGVETVVFIGAALGINPTLEVGDCVILTETQALEGVLQFLENTSYSYPDNNLSTDIMVILDKKELAFTKVKVVSVISSFAQTNWKCFDNDVDVLEMETSCLFHYAKKLDMKSVAVLIISDTKDHKIYYSQEERYKKMIKVFRKLIEE